MANDIQRRSVVTTAAASRRATASRRSVLFVVWPEPGHTTAVAAVARSLEARGDRVAFASAEKHGAHLRAQGFEHFDLGQPTEPGRPSVFGRLQGRAALAEAVDALVASLADIMARVRPSLVLLDSLYSPFTLAVEAAGIPWAIYETDLPREFDPVVPPPQLKAIPGATPGSNALIRSAWLNQLSRTFYVRDEERRPERRDLVYHWGCLYYPGALVDELERRFGKRVRFDRFIHYMPVARGPRMVFCTRSFDFERTRSAHGTWVGPCIDDARAEPPFPWDALPPDLPIAYASFGTQSQRDAAAPKLLQRIVDAFAARDDLFLVLACPDAQRPRLPPDSRRMLVVPHAPQLALLRRAAVALTHAGFNSLKECVACGVPMVALPLSHDQPRNATLVERHRLGVAFDPLYPPDASQIDQALTHVLRSAEIREGCARMKRAFDEARGYEAALAFIDDAMDAAPSTLRCPESSWTHA